LEAAKVGKANLLHYMRAGTYCAQSRQIMMQNGEKTVFSTLNASRVASVNNWINELI